MIDDVEETAEDRAHRYKVEEEFNANTDLDAISKEALRDVCKNALKKYYRKLALTDKVKPKLLEQTITLCGLDVFQKEDHGVNRWFITISAKDGINFVQFFKQMEKCRMKARMLGTGYYVLEQRSEADQEPYGFHIHWLLQTTDKQKKGILVQQVYQCFVKYLAGANYVDVRPVYTDDAWSQKLRYIQGHKVEDKMLKCQKDSIIRKKYLIPEIVQY